MYKRYNEIERLLRRLKWLLRIYSCFEKLDVRFLQFIPFAITNWVRVNFQGLFKVPDGGLFPKPLFRRKNVTPYLIRGRNPEFAVNDEVPGSRFRGNDGWTLEMLW